MPEYNGANTMDYGKFAEVNIPNYMLYSEQPAAGQTIVQRSMVNSTTGVTGSGSLRLIYFNAFRSELVSKVKIITGNTAVVTPTLIRMGLYKVADSGDLTLVASTPNDLTLFAVAGGIDEKSFSQPYYLEEGQRYAFAILVVATTPPTIYGYVTVAAVSGNFISPKLTALLSSQSDLPATILDSALANSGYGLFAALLP